MSIIFQQVIRQNDGVLALNTGTGAPVDPIPSQGLLLDSDGHVYATDVTPPNHYFAGLPFDADGRLVVEAAPITYYNQGLPYTANHALAGGDADGGGYYNQGVFFNSSGAVVVTGLVTVPDQVQNLELTPGDEVIDASWDAVVADPAVTNYRVEYRLVGAPSWTTADVGLVTSYQITGLTNSETYEVRVAAENTEGFGAYSTVETAEPFLPPPAPTVWGPLPQDLNNPLFSGVHISTVDSDEAGTWVAAGQNGGASISTDDGATWTALPQGLNAGGTASDSTTVVKTDRQGTWIAGRLDARLAISTDNGATWSALPQGLNSGATTQWVDAIDTDEAGTWVVVFRHGYAARSTDNGATWSALPRYLNSLYTSSISRWVMATDTHGKWIAGVSLDNEFAAVSTDNGATWTGRDWNEISSMTAFATDTNGRWLQAREPTSSHRSLDDAETWTGTGSGITDDIVNHADTDRFGNWVAVGTNGSATVNTDNLATQNWTDLGDYLNSGAVSGTIRGVASSGMNGVWIAVMEGGFAAISPPLV